MKKNLQADQFYSLKRLGIDTHQEAIVYMRDDCVICRAEGFKAHSRVQITTQSASIIATLNIVYDGFLAVDEVGLSESAWKLLQASEGEKAKFSHPKTMESVSYLRSKIYGNALTQEQMSQIVQDISAGHYTDIELSAFITACAGNRVNLDEMAYLAEAMVKAGKQLSWSGHPIMDKHSIGGLPGNRTTPIVVAIVAACGLTIPKTSSRAITSPAGTADTMETLTEVNLDIQTLRKVVEQENACLAWGGSVNLSPADDILIRVERLLDLDSDGQLVASILSKKLAAGSSHIVIDIPVGPTAKVRTQQLAEKLAHQLSHVGCMLGLNIKAVLTDGSQPVGRGIGPALEARDILAVLQRESVAPQELRERALHLSAEILMMGNAATKETALELARSTLDSGQAWKKFQAICEAQGGLRVPPKAQYRYDVLAVKNGILSSVNNRFLAKLAKLAGAPTAAAAGIDFNVKLGDKITKGDCLMTVYTNSPGELDYAIDYLKIHFNEILIAAE